MADNLLIFITQTVTSSIMNMQPWISVFLNALFIYFNLRY